MRTYRNAGELIRAVNTPFQGGGEASYCLGIGKHDGMFVIVEDWSGGGFSDETRLGEATTLGDAIEKALMLYDEGRHNSIKVYDSATPFKGILVLQPNYRASTIGVYGDKHPIITASEAFIAKKIGFGDFKRIVRENS